jgi:hypothetical protein
MFFVAFAWSIWLVNKPKDRVEAYSLVFAEAKSCAENYLTKAGSVPNILRISKNF